jgi:hypothetical protein
MRLRSGLGLCRSTAHGGATDFHRGGAIPESVDASIQAHLAPIGRSTAAETAPPPASTQGAVAWPPAESRAEAAVNRLLRPRFRFTRYRVFTPGENYD